MRDYQETIDSYLDAVDEALPGFVTGLYAVGSVALGGWIPGVSDIDTVVLTSREPSGDDLSRLAAIHAGLPGLDGVYIPPGLSWPSAKEVVPFVVNGEFHTGDPCGELTPVLWLTLDIYGIPLRGPRVFELGVRVDRDELRAYLLDNLGTYWRGLADEAEAAGVPDDADVPGSAVAWLVLGPARLHYTLAYRDIITKAAAGDYLVELFPEYADLVDRAIRFRAGEDQRFTGADLRLAARSVRDVIAAAG